MNNKKLYTKAEALVRERIDGFRKGTSDVPNWTHSIRVAELLKQNDCADEVIMAGILHDVIEDGGVTLDELRDMGFSERIVELVDLCSHSLAIKGSEKRWMTMMARLVLRDDRDAWLIKCADLLDNVKSCATMLADKQVFMKEVKGRLFLGLAVGHIGEHPLWHDLNRCISDDHGLKRWYVEIVDLLSGKVLWHYYLRANSSEIAEQMCSKRFIEEQQDDLLLDTGGSFMTTVEEDTWS